MPTTSVSVNSDKVPVAVEQAEGSFKKNPSWRFSKADIDHTKWSVLDAHEDIVEDPSDTTGTKHLHVFSRSIDRELLEDLRPREVMTWSDIMTQTGGKRKGTNSHFIPIIGLTKEAQQRAAELGIEADELFSMRTTGTKRVWGILEAGVLDIIWFDRDHEICPQSKR